MSPKESPGKKQLAVVVSADIVERAKNLVYWTPGVTLAGLVEEGLGKAVVRRERANGGQFAERPSHLQPGRPVALRDVPNKKRAALQRGSRGLRRPTPKDRTRNARKRG
jgi:hypothetical protein